MSKRWIHHYAVDIVYAAVFEEVACGQLRENGTDLNGTKLLAFFWMFARSQ